MKRALLSGFVVLTCVAVSAEPVAVWVSHPVKPGEHVLVSGGGWGEKATIEMDGRTIAPDCVSDTGLIFELPKDVGTGPKSFTIIGAARSTDNR